MFSPCKREKGHQPIAGRKAGVTHSVTRERDKMNVNRVLGTENFPGKSFCFNFLLYKYVARKYQSAIQYNNHV